MGKICVKCGAELEDAALFCDECGEKQFIQNELDQTRANNQFSINQEVHTNSKKQSGFGIASLVLGIVSVISLGILIIPQILGIIFGIIGVCDKSKKRSLALAGLILSGLAMLLIIIIFMI